MKNSRLYKSVELFIIFIIFPVLFTLPIVSIVKLILGILGFLYIIYLLVKVENLKLKINPDLNWKFFWKRTFIKFFFLVILSCLYVLFFDSEHFFQVVLQKPKLWSIILLVYAILSVYPQELIYRTFFFTRYTGLFKSKELLIFMNAILFSLGHLFFKNELVLLLTFVGGIVFALTFQRTQSTLLVSIEHAIYGCWLFTVGMGNMLGFPS